MAHKTFLYSTECTFWHATGLESLFVPAGGWVEPPAGTYGADTPASKRRLLNLVQMSGLSNDVPIVGATPATREDMLRIHTPGYIDRFKAVSDSGGGDVGDHAPFIVGGFEIAAASAGLAIEAVSDVVSGKAKNAYALCRPAGHHCLPDQSMGFCLLANIPIAIAAARAKHDLPRVAIIDWDVHHGNGAQDIYYERDDVLTISLHQENCFPPGYTGEDDRGAGAGAGYNINIPLPPGSGHDTYLAAFDKIILPALAKYQPDLIVVASGLDASAVDPLARMMLHSGTYSAMTKRLKSAAAQLCDDRLVIVHEGGYSEAYVPFCGHAIIAELAGVTSPVEDPFLDILLLQQPTKKTQEFQLQAVDDLAKIQ
ncbi:class II histone deacetylase [Croceicoccus sediminis]|uniref:class II histone deacetylase n=1 Tax=Croceicoccus sediminis TaxID=2571150 RepID=UPI0011822A32|nr:class II histone deacetylase [Croceicoccus sediminis]